MAESVARGPQVDTRLKIRAERLELLFQQSFRAAYTGMIMALLLAAMLWADTEHLTLIAWVLAIAVTGFSRLALYIQYNRLAPELDAIPRWESTYIGTLILYFMVWGFGGVLIIPEDLSLIHI